MGYGCETTVLPQVSSLGLCFKWDAVYTQQQMAVWLRPDAAVEHPAPEMFRYRNIQTAANFYFQIHRFYKAMRLQKIFFCTYT